jgi:hypothetical protein
LRQKEQQQREKQQEQESKVWRQQELDREKLRKSIRRQKLV